MASMPTTTGAEPSSTAQYTYTASTASYFPTPFHLQQTPPTSYIGAAPPPAVPSVQLPVYPAPPSVYSLPQYQQAQQLFQRDAQTITPEALESVKAALASSEIEHKTETKKKAIPRKAAGLAWDDPTLAEWPENDYRLFCGDLGNEVNDDVLSKVFTRFPSFNMARVVRDKRTGKTKGYGFVSFSNPADVVAALKEINDLVFTDGQPHKSTASPLQYSFEFGTYTTLCVRPVMEYNVGFGKYVGNRPIKLRKSTWRERTDYEALEKQKNHFQKKTKPPRKSVLHK